MMVYDEDQETSYYSLEIYAPNKYIEELVFREVFGWNKILKENPELKFETFHCSLGFLNFSIKNNTGQIMELCKAPHESVSTSMKLLCKLSHRFGLEMFAGDEEEWHILFSDSEDDFKWFRLEQDDIAFRYGVIHLANYLLYEYPKRMEKK